MYRVKKYNGIFTLFLLLLLFFGINMTALADTPEDSGMVFNEDESTAVFQNNPRVRLVFTNDRVYFMGSSNLVYGILKTNCYGTGYITRNATGINVIQAAVTACGYSTNGVDGIYGNNTTSAVKKFQNANGLKPDGICGPATLAVLASKVGYWTNVKLRGI